MMPSFGGVGGGKLTVIKAGPGFHEEKSYNIAADGHLTQTGDVKEVSMLGDGLDHANPMDSQFSSDDVEVFTVDSGKPATEAAAKEVEEKSPVMDVRGLEEQQPKQEPKQEPEEAKVEAKEFASEKLPYLSVLRNEVGEGAGYLHIHNYLFIYNIYYLQVGEEARDWSERLLASYRDLAEREYLDTECSSHNL